MEDYAKNIVRPGLVQPHGVCMLVNKKACVLAVSKNSMLLFRREPESLLNLDILEPGALFTQMSVNALREALTAPDVSIFNPIMLIQLAPTEDHPGESVEFAAIAHHTQEGILIDFEPQMPTHSWCRSSVLKTHQIALHSAQNFQKLPASGDIIALCQLLCDEMRTLTGYDRVMVYKFHMDNHGEVIAESISEDCLTKAHKEGMERYLGLHFPASDIPAMARELYLTNKSRIIVDVGAKPTTMVQAEQLKNPVLLGHSQLRGIAGCHAQYMANMNTYASLGLSIVPQFNEDTATTPKLWGLCVCHHKTKYYVPYAMRSAAEFLEQVFTVHLRTSTEAAERLARERSASQLAVLCDVATRSAGIVEDVLTHIATVRPGLPALLNASGAAILYKSQLSRIGQVPEAKFIHSLIEWSGKQPEMLNGGKVAAYDSLRAAGYPHAVHIRGTAAAALFLRVEYGPPGNRPSSGISTASQAAARQAKRVSAATPRVSPGSDSPPAVVWVVWFRKEIKSCINWAGSNDADVPAGMMVGNALLPRTSFNTFIQSVEFMGSETWSPLDTKNVLGLNLLIADALKFGDESGPWRALRQLVEEAGGGNSEQEIIQIAVDGLSEVIPRLGAVAGKSLQPPMAGAIPIPTSAEPWVVAARGNALREELAAACSGLPRQQEASGGSLEASSSVEFMLNSHTMTMHSSREHVKGTAAYPEWAAAANAADGGHSWTASFMHRDGVGLPIVVLVVSVGAPLRDVKGSHVIIAQDLRLLQDFAGAIGGLLRQQRQREIAEADRARASARVQRNFLASMSHELRTPLNAIVAFNTLALEEGQLNTANQEYITASLTAAEALLGIIVQILDASKFADEGAAQRLQLASAPFSLAKLAADLVDICGSKANRKDVEFIVDVDEELQGAWALGDAFRLRQCLINLSDNGIKFTEPHGEVVVRLRKALRSDKLPRGAAQDDGSGFVSSPSGINGGRAERLQRHSFDAMSGSRVVEVAMTVCDSGTGIEPSKFGLVFRPFSQLSNRAEASSAGTGLGLSIVKFLVERMGGVVTFASVPGVGTTFIAKVPIRLLPGLHSPSALGLLPLTKQVPPPFSAAGLRVVLLIPRTSQRIALGHMLRAEGVSVDETAVNSIGWLQPPGRSAFSRETNVNAPLWTPAGVVGSTSGPTSSGVHSRDVLLRSTSKRKKRQSLTSAQAMAADLDNAIKAGRKPGVFVLDVANAITLLDAGVTLPRPGMPCLVLGRTEDLPDFRNAAPELASVAFVRKPVKAHSLLEHLRRITSSDTPSLVVPTDSPSAIAIAWTAVEAACAEANRASSTGTKRRSSLGVSFAAEGGPTASADASVLAALPVVSSYSAATAGVSLSAPSSLNTPSGLTILVVDDNATNVKVAVAVLRRCGYSTVETATNGELATAAVMAAVQPFMVIFMDLQMPVCDGHEATRRIRAWEAANPAVKSAYIVALTAHAGDDHRSECLQDGFSDFLTKPVTPQSVRQALCRFASAATTAKAAAEAPAASSNDLYPIV